LSRIWSDSISLFFADALNGLFIPSWHLCTVRNVKPAKPSVRFAHYKVSECFLRSIQVSFWEEGCTVYRFCLQLCRVIPRTVYVRTSRSSEVQFSSKWTKSTLILVFSILKLKHLNRQISQRMEFENIIHILVRRWSSTIALLVK